MTRVFILAVIVLTLASTGCRWTCRGGSCKSHHCASGGCESCGEGGEGCADGRSGLLNKHAANKAARRYGTPHEYEGNSGPATGTYAYPYYTTRGPRDYFLNNPPTIGR